MWESVFTRVFLPSLSSSPLIWLKERAFSLVSRKKNPGSHGKLLGCILAATTALRMRKVDKIDVQMHNDWHFQCSTSSSSSSSGTWTGRRIRWHAIVEDLVPTPISAASYQSKKRCTLQHSSNWSQLDLHHVPFFHSDLITDLLALKQKTDSKKCMKICKKNKRCVSFLALSNPCDNVGKEGWKTCFKRKGRKHSFLLISMPLTKETRHAAGGYNIITSLRFFEGIWSEKLYCISRHHHQLLDTTQKHITLELSRRRYFFRSLCLKMRYLSRHGVSEREGGKPVEKRIKISIPSSHLSLSTRFSLSLSFYLETESIDTHLKMQLY